MVLLMTSDVKRQVLVAFCDILFLQVWNLAIYLFLLVNRDEGGNVMLRSIISPGK